MKHFYNYKITIKRKLYAYGFVHLSLCLFSLSLFYFTHSIFFHNTDIAVSNFNQFLEKNIPEFLVQEMLTNECTNDFRELEGCLSPHFTVALSFRIQKWIFPAIFETIFNLLTHYLIYVPNKKRENIFNFFLSMIFQIKCTHNFSIHSVQSFSISFFSFARWPFLLFRILRCTLFCFNIFPVEFICSLYKSQKCSFKKKLLIVFYKTTKYRSCS